MTEDKERVLLARWEDALDSAKWWNWHADRDGGPRFSPNKIGAIQARINRLRIKLGLVQPKKEADVIQRSLFQEEPPHV